MSSLSAKHNYSRDDSDVVSETLVGHRETRLPPYLHQQHQHSMSDLGPTIRRNSHRSLTSSSSNSDCGSGASGRVNSENGTRSTIMMKKSNSDIPIGGKNIRGVSHRTLMNIRAIHSNGGGSNNTSTNNSVASSVHDNQSVGSNGSATNGGKTSRSASNRSSFSSSSSCNSGMADYYPPFNGKSVPPQAYPLSASSPMPVPMFTPTSPNNLARSPISKTQQLPCSSSPPLESIGNTALYVPGSPMMQSPGLPLNSSSSSSLNYCPPSSSSSSMPQTRGIDPTPRSPFLPPYKQFDYGNLRNMVQSPDKQSHSMSLSSSSNGSSVLVHGRNNSNNNLKHYTSSSSINSASSVGGSGVSIGSNNTVPSATAGVSVSGGSMNSSNNSRKLGIVELSASALMMNSNLLAVSGSLTNGSLTPPPPPNATMQQQHQQGHSQQFWHNQQQQQQQSSQHTSSNQKVYEKFHPAMMTATKHSLDLLACESRDSEEEMRLLQQEQERRGSGCANTVYQGPTSASGGGPGSRSYDSASQGLSHCLPDKPLLKVVFVGDSNVGKTTLIRHYFDTIGGGGGSGSNQGSMYIPTTPTSANTASNSSNKPTIQDNEHGENNSKSNVSATNTSKDNSKSTTGVDFRAKNVTVGQYDCKFQVWDTSGSEKLQVITRAYYKGAHAFGIVYDITNEASIQRIPYWIDELRTAITEYSTSSTSAIANPFPPPIVLIGNKVDLEDGRLVTASYVENYARENGLKGYVETSGVDGFQVKDLMEIMMQLAFRYVSSNPDFYAIHAPSVALSDLTQSPSWIADTPTMPAVRELLESPNHKNSDEMEMKVESGLNALMKHSSSDTIKRELQTKDEVDGPSRASGSMKRPSSNKSSSIDRALKPEARSGSCNSLDSFLSDSDQKVSSSSSGAALGGETLATTLGGLALLIDMDDARHALLRCDTLSSANSGPTSPKVVGTETGTTFGTTTFQSSADAVGDDFVDSADNDEIVYKKGSKAIEQQEKEKQRSEKKGAKSAKEKGKENESVHKNVAVVNDNSAPMVGCRCTIS